VDSFKVDRSFVHQMRQGKKNYQIVKTIMALSQQLEISAIAEGIETEQEKRELQRLGYHFGQGYLFSHPLSAEEMTRKLQALL
jgi:EAL domain-containing protein (putative c-di-GMP-specific phosphodiesterase class I)